VTKKKRSVEEILAILDEDEKDDALIAAVEKMSDEEVEREIRAAGIDVEKIKARVLAARPPSFAWKAAPWVVAAAIVVAAIVYALTQRAPGPPADPPEAAPPQPASAPTPSELPSRDFVASPPPDPSRGTAPATTPPKR